MIPFVEYVFMCDVGVNQCSSRGLCIERFLDIHIHNTDFANQNFIISLALRKRKQKYGLDFQIQFPFSCKGISDTHLQHLMDSMLTVVMMLESYMQPIKWTTTLLHMNHMPVNVGNQVTLHNSSSSRINVSILIVKTFMQCNPGAQFH